MRKRIPKWKKEIRRYKKGLTSLLIVVFGLVNVLFPVGGTNSFFSDSETMSISATSGTWGTGPIVINEFLPNPTGDDNAPKTEGEWVELYNTGSTDINVAGWYIYDNDNSHALAINNTNTNTGGTNVPASGYLVVYRNGDLDFELNNDSGDSVRLFNNQIGYGGTLIDSYTYDTNNFCNLDPTAGSPNSGSGSGSCSTVPENKSFARIPNGTAAWIDPYPTPGEPNVMEGPIQEELTLPEDEMLPMPEILTASISEETPLDTSDEGLTGQVPEPTPSPSITPEPIIDNGGSVSQTPSTPSSADSGSTAADTPSTPSSADSGSTAADTPSTTPTDTPADTPSTTPDPVISPEPVVTSDPVVIETPMVVPAPADPPLNGSEGNLTGQAPAEPAE